MKLFIQIKNHFRNLWPGSFAIGLASLLWLLIRTGTKPSRVIYPCQRMAAANASVWLGAAAVPVLLNGMNVVRKNTTVRLWLVVSATVLLSAVLFAAVDWGTPSVPSALVAGSGEGIRGTGRVELKLAENIAGRPTSSDIFVVQGTNGADDGFTRLVQMIERDGGGFYRPARDSRGVAEGRAGAGNFESGIVGAGDVVIIKVNGQWNQRGGTNTDLVGAIVRAILDHPAGFRGEVIIADNGQAQYGSSGRGGSLDWAQNNALDPSQSIQDVAEAFTEDHRVSVYLWDNITTIKVDEFSESDPRDGYVVAGGRSQSTGIIVSYPKFTTRYGTSVSFALGIWDPETRTYDSERLVVINVPVLKSHSTYGVTAAVKHYMGVVSDKLTSHNAHRSVASGGMGTQMVETRVPALNVIDAIWINARPGNGPSTPYPAATETNIVTASRDPVALDTWTSINVLIAAAEQLGHTRTWAMDPRVSSSSKFSRWLELSAAELREAGYPATTDLSAVNIRVQALR